MAFSDPLYLLLLIPAIAWVVIVARDIHGMARLRRRISVGVRAGLLLLLILALAGLQTARRNRGVTTIFVLDRSASMPAAASRAAETFIGNSLSERGQDDQAGLIVFGHDPIVDVNPGSLKSLGRIYGQPDTSATDLAAAIRLAAADFPSGSARRIVVLSDGNETSGDAAEAAAVAATDGIQIDVVPPPETARSGGEVVLSDLSTPDHVTKGEPFEVRVVANATGPASGVIRLDRDGVPVATVPVRLTKGSNAFVVSQTANAPGFFRYRATLETDNDTDSRNNTGIAYVGVQGRPKVLLVEGAAGSSAALEQALKTHKLDVVRTGAEGLPTRSEDLQEYDGILLNDFPAEGLTDSQMKLIASAVRESGIGFGMIGGENSFLPGGYYGTSLAEVLPVDMNVRQRQTFPSSTILIVCDTSGSMGMIEDGVPKVKIAATAAAATVQMMNANDYIGVAGSTDAIEFVAPIQRAVDKAKIAAECGQLDTGGGGIYIRPSLEFAEKNLINQNTRVRHLILMADGDDCDTQEGSFALARKMVAEKMTISVVSIGTGKDVPFLKALAAIGKGQFYLALQAKQLQRMFTRDTAIMSRSAIEEGTFLPKVDPGDEVLRGLDLHAMPPLHAYDLTGDRPLARVPMRSAKDDPLLAFWQYGLGTSMAFTSDAQPKWARPWMAWPDFGAFWAQAVRSMLRRASNNRIEVSAHRAGGKAVVNVEAFDPNGNPINALPARVNVMSPDSHAQTVTLRQQGPGRYEGDFDAADTGGYVISVAEGGQTGGAPQVTRAGFSIAYPPEYQAIGPNLPLLKQIAHVTGGTVLTKPAEAFRAAGKPGDSIRDLWPALLLAAALLFPADVAVRRLALPFGEAWALVFAMAARLRRRVKEPAVVPQAAAIARLSQARKDATPPKADVPPPAANVPPPVPTPKPQSPPPASSLTAAQRLLEIKRQKGEGGKSDGDE